MGYVIFKFSDVVWFFGNVNYFCFFRLYFFVFVIISLEILCFYWDLGLFCCLFFGSVLFILVIVVIGVGVFRRRREWVGGRVGV